MVKKVETEPLVVKVYEKESPPKPPGEECTVEILSFVTDGRQSWNLYGLTIKVNGSEYKTPVVLHVPSGETYSFSVEEIVNISQENLQFVKWVVEGREIKKTSIPVKITRDMIVEVFYAEI